ncbi:MAG: transposase [Planctomycetes bacterium]|nr:transposase [Planctomycetota bacterium]
MARENVTWGYDRIVGALARLGHRVAPTTVRNVLKKHGIDPAPERRHEASWRRFLRTHGHAIAASDFFTTEVWTARRLVTFHTLFVIDLATRAVTIVGTTPHPGEDFMLQVARNRTDCVDGFLTLKRFLILDRDQKFSERFRRLLGEAGVKVLLCPPRAPICNACAERFVRSIKSECLDRMIFVGSGSLRHALAKYAAHYNAERPHQGIGNVLIEPNADADSAGGRVVRDSRLGGHLSYYHRLTA